MSRTETLARLRAALRRRKPSRLPDQIPELPVFEDPVARFCEQLAVAGGRVQDARSQGLEKCLSTVLAEAGTDSIVWEEQSTLEDHSIPYRRLSRSAFEDRHLVWSNHPHGEVAFPLVLSAREMTLARVEGVGGSCSRMIR